MKKIIITIFVIGLAFAVYFSLTKKQEPVVIVTPDIVSDTVSDVSVEQYIRDNVATLVPEESVLGGSWYILSIDLDEQTKTGIMTYEDGHIMGSATFSYDQENGVVMISDIKKINDE